MRNIKKRPPGFFIKTTLIRVELGFYWFWAALRLILTLIPQTGYIHPDEYFQTVEVFAGDVFGTEVSLPWEFNKTFPIRSIPVVYITTLIPLTLLKTVSQFLEMYTGINLLTPYMLLVTPRLVMCLLSFVSDYCLFKICYLYGQNYKERLIMFSSSFVCLVFMTRTFSNTIEIICFNYLLYLVASCMAESEKINYQNDYLKDKYSEASTIADRVRITKLIKLLPKHSLKRCMPIAITTVCGIFNRPTFVLFAVAPLFYWFQRGLPTKPSFLKDFHMRIFLFIAYCCPVACLFIFADSVYYGHLTWGEMLNYKISFNNFVVTPLNFVKYNLDSSNLSKHGLHPRFLHILINVPLLYNVLGISGLLVILKLVYRGSLSYWTLLPKSQSITGMMTLSFVAPVVGLSAFPHQEPRFITPSLLPLVFLYSHLIRDFEEDCVTVAPFRKRRPQERQVTGILKLPLQCLSFIEKATEKFDNRYNINGRYLTKLKREEIVRVNHEARETQDTCDAQDDMPDDADDIADLPQGCGPEGKQKEGKNELLKLWYLCNALCVLFFGFLHQGGIYSLSKNMHELLVHKPRYSSYHLVTSHVYSLPLHLLMIKPNFKSKSANLVAYELGSDNFENIHLKLVTILKVSEAKKKTTRRNYRIYYALPTSLFNEFRFSYHYYSSNYSYSIEDIFYPHFSTEALPNLILNVTQDSEFHFSKGSGLGLSFLPVRYLMEFIHQFGLVLIQIKSC